jgi:hypothetical protein
MLRCVSSPALRRPGVSAEEGYFASRYIGATVSMELEASLVEQLTSAVAKEERSMLVMTHATAATAATAASAATVTHEKLERGPGPLLEQSWRPGIPPGIVYGTLLSQVGGMTPRSLMQEGAVLPGVGAAAAALPGQIRRVVEAFADLHQVSYVQLNDICYTPRAMLTFNVCLLDAS